ncbi:hypothetical protein VIGAN_08318400 [Vigna angularis var. angularis]|uniref:Uncharacterized protein n=1 Tax=Vigna angularis var. angularis TaxID=157739 RepID=A0A0S3STX1_PHAAN|nr:hypothetical protein VIGAN_08318400 [Vigna angularis var. angularis]
MPNLSYNMFDIDLNKIPSDSDLKLLLHTTSRLVVVIKDPNCFVVEKITRISVLEILNFINKLITSCCMEERMMVSNVTPRFRHYNSFSTKIHI